MEIWSECFGFDPMAMKKQDAYAITAIMAKMEGWEKTNTRKRISMYGMQRVYARTGVTV